MDMRSAAHSRAAWLLRFFPLSIVAVISLFLGSALAQSTAPTAIENADAQEHPARQTAPAPGSTDAAQSAPGESAQPASAQTDAAQTDNSQPLPAEPGSGDQGMFVFKKQVEEVVLHATVVDEQQRLVTGLDKAAFSIYENGVQQTITSFRREDVPVELGIVVDNSGSMRDKRGQVEQAVVNLIRASNAADQVFLVNFGQNPYLDQDFTSDANLLQAALHQVSAKGSTALYDAIVASDVHLENNPRLSKKVLLVITDGQDNMSLETLQDASRKLQQANGPTLYAIGLLGSGLNNEGRKALQQLAAATGGVAYFPDSLDQVDNITRTVAHDIRSQYTIAFRPKNQNVKPEYQSLRLEAHAPEYGKLTVRTRSGYYSPDSGH
jgi:VWFA-related protein